MSIFGVLNLLERLKGRFSVILPLFDVWGSLAVGVFGVYCERLRKLVCWNLILGQNWAWGEGLNTQNPVPYRQSRSKKNGTTKFRYMNIFSYHLVEIPLFQSVKNIISKPIPKYTNGLIHSEYMTAMTLGSAILSTSRILIGQVAVFMQWENEISLENYLDQNPFGRVLAKGWHIRLSFIREWGKFSGFQVPEIKSKLKDTSSPVVAVTIARMKPLAVPRFIYWGRPVEKLVRDHPGTTLSLASVKFLNTVSTFSIWKTEKEMTDMVHGHSKVDNPKRHSAAMKERERKNFHYEFSTLRFKPLSEFGEWKGRSNFIPFTSNLD